jgi:hypothetical protein
MKNLPDQGKKKNILSFKIANESLFVLVFCTIFLVPVLTTGAHRFAYSFLFTAIILTGTQLISKNRTMLFTYAVIAIAMVWLGDVLDLHAIREISRVFNVILFMFIVIDLVKQVSGASMVTPKVILEAINGYLLIGLVFSIAVGMLSGLSPGSFSFNNLTGGATQPNPPYMQNIYYAFTTLTTVGYGDLVPLTSVARSLSVLISVTGQLYIAVVIAMLVGKYISQAYRTENPEEN